MESYRSLTQLPKPEFTRVNLDEFFERITILANSYFDSEINNSEIRPVISTRVEPVSLTLIADDKLLAQVFMNIIKNSYEAINQSEKGSEIVIETIRNHDGRIEITVKDDGPGMDPETLEKIFVPFFTTKESGSGIGLSLSRQIVRIHNGNILCESTPGKGTSIIMTF